MLTWTYVCAGCSKVKHVTQCQSVEVSLTLPHAFVSPACTLTVDSVRSPCHQLSVPLSLAGFSLSRLLTQRVDLLESSLTICTINPPSNMMGKWPLCSLILMTSTCTLTGMQWESLIKAQSVIKAFLKRCITTQRESLSELKLKNAV